MVHNLLTTELESKSMMKRHVEKFSRHRWLRRVCYGLALLAIAAIVALVSFQPDQNSATNRSILNLPSSMIPYYWQREVKNQTTAQEMHIEDVVSFDSDVLVLVHVPLSLEFPSKDRLECRYGGVTHYAYRKAKAMHHYSGRAAVLCGAPPESLAWDVSSVLIEVDKEVEIRTGEGVREEEQPLQWNSSKVVYEAFLTEKDVVVFVHGINHTRGAHLPNIPEQERLKSFQCVYGGYFETCVTAQSQEVFRCGHPPEHLIPDLTGKKMAIRLEGTILPSVAYYNPKANPKQGDSHTLFGTINRKLLAPSEEDPQSHPKKHHICSCTMIYNGAKFLKEWVYYNSHLGVEKFFLYDNNSDDNVDEVIASLASFNVTKQAWPWVKTQEAGFSHCSMLGQAECTWMLFTDIDEYFFPNAFFLREDAPAKVGEGTFVPSTNNAPASSNGEAQTLTLSSPILATFIEEAVAVHDPVIKVKVGQISTFCHNFGPSNLTISPPQGVTQGYTCRLKKKERHKSIVLLSAIDNSLANVIHHFTLRPGYDQKMIKPMVAVINHYKFQVWDEFKAKFHRRAATYVADWTEDRKLESKDRVPNLGTKAVKPADWETRYCEVQDYDLRNYTQRIFGTHDSDGALHLPWE